MMSTTAAAPTTTNTLSSPEELELMAEATDLAAKSISARTRDAYSRDWTLFAQWCDQRNYVAMPVAPAVVALFVTDQARTLKPSTIRQAHLAAGHPLEIPDPVRRIIRGHARDLATTAAEEGQRSVARQAKALSARDVIVILANISGDDIKAKRDRTLIAIGFSGMFRRSELVALTTSNVETDGRDLIVHLAKSKTDQEGRGHERRICSGESICAAIS